jgi:hypothetical protein
LVLDKAQVKKNKAKGAAFELKVRFLFESQGWTIAKWSNTVQNGEIVRAKPLFFGGRITTVGVGFPDFVAFRPKGELYEVVFVECKVGGYLKTDEKEKITEYKRRGFKCFLAYPDNIAPSGVLLGAL